MAQKYFKGDVQKIESLRVSRGWSRDALATKAIVSTRTLDSIMAGENGVLSTFTKIAKAFDVPIQSILEDYTTKLADRVPNERLWSITITVSTPFDQFDEPKDLKKLIKALYDRLNGDEIDPTSVRPGSTKIDFQMSHKHSFEFVLKFASGTFDDLGITSVLAPLEYGHRKVDIPLDNLVVFGTLSIGRPDNSKTIEILAPPDYALESAGELYVEGDKETWSYCIKYKYQILDAVVAKKAELQRLKKSDDS